MIEYSISENADDSTETRGLHVQPPKTIQGPGHATESRVHRRLDTPDAPGACCGHRVLVSGPPICTCSSGGRIPCIQDSLGCIASF